MRHFVSKITIGNQYNLLLTFKSLGCVMPSCGNVDFFVQLWPKCLTDVKEELKMTLPITEIGSRLEFVRQHVFKETEMGFAKKLNIDRKSYYRFIRNDNLELKTIRAICRKLNISARWLIFGEGDHADGYQDF
jgi:hypothetical protein